MLKILYSPGFISQFERLDKKTKNLAFEKTDLFIENQKHPSLRTHKLKGRLSNHFSFSVDYTMRIVFIYDGKGIVRFLKIGDHSVYR